MTIGNNSIGAIPLVVTLGHSVSTDKIPDPNTFLTNWYAQFTGAKAGKVPFNISDDNYLIAAPPPSNGSLTINSQASNPYSLYDLAWNQEGSITPYLFATNPDYTNAYTKAVKQLNDVFSSSNPDIRVNETSPKFPVFWLSGIQSFALILASGKPTGLNGTNASANLVNSSGGAPAPVASGLNYVLHEGYYGLDPKTDKSDSNNGDATYIEQFSIPNSLILWYTDSKGNLYRGVRSASAENLSVPGAGSFINTSGQYQSSYNNGLQLATAISEQFESAKVFSNKENGTLYANPKDTFGTEANAILDPAFGNYYQYQYSLPKLYGVQHGTTTVPVTWTGNYKDTYYKVNSITYKGFDDASSSPHKAFDDNAYVQLSVNYGSRSADLNNSADIRIPWLGYNPGKTSQSNSYSIVSPGGASGSGPSGGWMVEWDSSYDKVWMGSSPDNTTNLKAFSDTSPVTVSGGPYGATSLFKYYVDLFEFEPGTEKFAGKSLTYAPNQGLFTAKGDTITAYPGFEATKTGVNGNGQWITADGTTYLVTYTGKPNSLTTGPLNLGGEANNTQIQIQYVGGTNPWQVNVPTTQNWIQDWQGNVQQSSTFSVANGGNLNGDSPVSVTVTVQSSPSVSIKPEKLRWTNLTESNGNGAILQAMVDANGNWHLKGDPSSSWSGSGIGTSFTTGVLQNGFQPTFTLAKAPDATATSDQVGLIFSADKTNFTAPAPITSFTATDTSGTKIATLTPNSIWKANQLAQSSSNPFTYAANEAGIAGANAGSYTLNTVGAVVNTYQDIQDFWDSGGVVGDYLSLLNAGLLGATGKFTYNQKQVNIGDLYTLQGQGAVSPWFDKAKGPVANGKFGQAAWAKGDKGNNYWNTWSSVLNAYAPSVYSFGLSDRFADSYDIKLNLKEITPKSGDKFLKYITDATTAESTFNVVEGSSIEGMLYPLFIEYQIGGFGQPSDPGYKYSYDFLPDYNQARAIVNVPTPQGEKQIRVEFQGGELRPGSDVEIISDLGINQAALQDLAGLGVKTNATAIAFQLATDPGAEASLSSDPNLVAAEFLADLRDPFGRLPARKLLYYALNTATGALSPLSYDPITGAGARFFDLNNDGTPDFFTLSLIDGGYGDKDGLANGVIVDPSVAGFVDLTNLQFTSAGSGTVTVSDPSNTAPAAVNLRATLNSRPDSSNQIGYVVLNADEVASADALLSDLNWLRGRAQTLFSTLESKDVTLPPAGSAFARDLQLINGQSLRFFEVVDASLEQLSSLSDSRFRRLSSAAFANGQVAFSSTSGVSFSLSLLPSDLGLNALISTAQGRAPVLDLSAFTAAQSLSGSVVLGREADFNSSAGFYRSLDANGTVIAADGITRLRPGDSAYAAEALRSSNLIAQLGNLAVADNQTTSRSFSGLSGGSFLAPFAQVNGNTFFAYGAASTDGISHFRALGNNLFGLEDIVGGGDRDFDDLVIGFNFDAVA